MANRYPEAALMAVRMDTYGKAFTPLERWQDAIGKLYPTAEKARRKSSPRQAFLGLCAAGMVRGIAPGGEREGGLNAGYAVQAVELLRAGTHTTVSQLWAAVAGPDKQHDHQMDVVLALWKNGLIVSA